MDYLGTINAKKKSQNKYRLFEYPKSKDALDIYVDRTSLKGS